MPVQYRLRYFFETGSGICLWSANDTARQRFGYPVDLDELPLPETIRRRGYFLIAWDETFMDWENAPESSRWHAKEQPAINAVAQEFLALLREHLGPEYDVIDESRTEGPGHGSR